MSYLRSFLGCQRGGSAAEMALVLPFLTVLLFGGLEVSYYFYCQHQVVKGVRDGARYASRQSFQDINCDAGTIPALLQTDIQEITRTGRISGGTARLAQWSNAMVTVGGPDCPATPVDTGIYAEETNAPVVTVSATVPYRSLFAGVGILNDTYNLTADQQAAVMGI